jgi:small-conductance mechanosensitive channel
VKTIIKTSLVLAAIAAASMATATAQDNRAGRYTMHKTDDGLVRLDTETGAVSLCQKVDQDWRCQPMAGAASAPGELARLRRKNAELMAEIKRMEDNLGLNGNRDRSANNKRNFKLPSEKEVDQALNYFERMLRKFQDRLKRLEQRPEAPERQL